MCYVCLGMGFYLANTGKDLVAFTGLIGVILGIYTAGNVTEANVALKHGAKSSDEV